MNETQELDVKFEQFAADPAAAGKKLEEFERSATRGFIINALRRNRGNQCRTAAELGIHRNTLSRTVRLLGLEAYTRSYVTFRKNL